MWHTHVQFWQQVFTKLMSTRSYTVEEAALIADKSIEEFSKREIEYPDYSNYPY